MTTMISYPYLVFSQEDCFVRLGVIFVTLLTLPLLTEDQIHYA